MAKQNLYIFNFSVFIFKIIALVFLFGYLLNTIFETNIIFKSEIGGAFKVNRILKETNVDEIPIFGSSRAQGNFVPSIIDDNCFNYGIDGTQANIWLFFLEQELNKDKTSPIIINFDLVGLVNSDGDIGNYIPNWNVTKSILKSQGEFYYNIPFVKYFGQFETNIKYFLNSKMNLTKIIDHGGSFEKNVLTTKKFKELVNKRLSSESSFQLDNRLQNKFNSLIESTDRKILIVVSPYHESCFNKFTNIHSVNQYLQELGKKKNIYVLDFRDYIKSDEMYMNTTHLNYKGAKKFTEKLKTTTHNILYK